MYKQYKRKKEGTEKQVFKNVLKSRKKERLTVFVALPDGIKVFHVDEVVAGVSHHLSWTQIHIF